MRSEKSTILRVRFCTAPEGLECDVESQASRDTQVPSLSVAVRSLRIKITLRWLRALCILTRASFFGEFQVQYGSTDVFFLASNVSGSQSRSTTSSDYQLACRISRNGNDRLNKALWNTGDHADSRHSQPPEMPSGRGLMELWRPLQEFWSELPMDPASSSHQHCIRAMWTTSTGRVTATRRSCTPFPSVQLRLLQIPMRVSLPPSKRAISCSRYVTY